MEETEVVAVGAEVGVEADSRTEVEVGAASATEAAVGAGVEEGEADEVDSRASLRAKRPLSVSRRGKRPLLLLSFLLF